MIMTIVIFLFFQLLLRCNCHCANRSFVVNLIVSFPYLHDKSDKIKTVLFCLVGILDAVDPIF